MTTVDSRVIAVLSRSAMLPESELGRDKTLAELGIGSLEQIECMLGLEDEFQVELSDTKLRKLKTVQDLVDFVKTAVAERGRRAGR